MPNPFYQNQSTQQYSNFRNMYQAMVNSKNPMQLLNNLALQNPNMKPIVDMLNKGANPQQLFTSLCQQRGINPQEFLKQITG